MVIHTVSQNTAIICRMYRQSAILEGKAGVEIQPGDQGRMGDAGGRVN